MKSKIKHLALAIIMLLPVTAFAHPGHGAVNEINWLHYLTSPIHLGVGLILLLLLLITGSYFMNRKKQSR